jgi:three-Cys-motif partner protein
MGYYIIGSYFPRAYFIDCFAGRGKYYKDGQKDVVSGSPLIVVEISLEVKKIKQKKGRNFDLNVIVIETDKNNLMSLKEFIRKIDPNNLVSVEFYESKFEEAIPDIVKKTSNTPAFFFIDPYGIKGIDKKTLDLIVNRKGSSEIFLNYMKMGVTRMIGQYKNIDHRNDNIKIKAIKTVSHIDSLFGDRSWIGKDDEELLRYFVKQVFSKNYKFVLNFNVPYPDRLGTIYNLLFTTNYEAAEKIMKDIMTAKLFKGTLFENCPFNIDWNIK